MVRGHYVELENCHYFVVGHGTTAQPYVVFGGEREAIINSVSLFFRHRHKPLEEPLRMLRPVVLGHEPAELGVQLPVYPLVPLPQLLHQGAQLGLGGVVGQVGGGRLPGQRGGVKPRKKGN